MSLNPSLILRIGAGLCFIGHGTLALGANAKFVLLLSTFGIEEAQAIMLLKGIGVLDISVGLMILFKPTKSVLIWAMIWTGLTIVAWGIHGDSLMHLLRRATYLATPAALLIMLHWNKSSRFNPQLKKLQVVPIEISGKSEVAIENLDLSMVCMKLMDVYDGEGWSKKQCDEVTKEYKRYLQLNLLFPNAGIVPNLAIDTMWHYHILDTEAYYRDCHAIFGHILHHYPYFGMKGKEDEKQFISAFDQTKLLYNETFATSMDGPDFLPSFRSAG